MWVATAPICIGAVANVRKMAKFAAGFCIALQVRSMAIEGTTLYTVRDSDVTVTDISSGMMSYTTKGSFEGRTPLVLVGGDDPAHKKFVACSTRDGKGLALYHNDGQFKNAWTAQVRMEILHFSNFCF